MDLDFIFNDPTIGDGDNLDDYVFASDPPRASHKRKADERSDASPPSIPEPSLPVWILCSSFSSPSFQKRFWGNKSKKRLRPRSSQRRPRSICPLCVSSRYRLP